MNYVQITEVYINESDAVVRFLHEKYDDLGRSLVFWQKRTKLWWDDNPCFSTSLPIGWGLWKSHRLVGFLGCIFTKLSFNGSKYRALNLTCWYVESDFRGRSLDLFLMANKFMPEAVYFNTSPTPHVEKILKVAKYQKYIIEKDHLMCKLFPLNVEKYSIGSRSEFRIKFFSPFLKFTEILFEFYTSRIWNKKEMFISDIHAMDSAELNFFVDKIQNNRLVIDRSFKFYQWLANAEHNKYHILIAKDSKYNQIIAIALFQTFEYRENLILELVDYCSEFDGRFKDKVIIRKMIANIFESKDIFSQYVAISFTEYSGINLKNCPGLLLRRSRNNKYLKTVHDDLKQIFENNSLDDLQNLVINIEDKLTPIVVPKKPRKNEQEQ